ncbi:hypothetical protein M2277_006466 [Paenibacillus sp. LBL]|uniref:chromosome partitioning protein ParA n=1 Tax=Paenibacillus sp. LBL TaxID=2940563 RepID=UPI0024767028|nr:chromosome partitioning protein ParA [Paenibacillus sp. LBL]MDH6675745.1 hypothetical protein [Paenibacillus sp. LBL]
MGKTIAFWSPVKGQTGTTSNVLATSTLIGTEYISKKVLVTHTDEVNSSLEHGFFSKLNRSENDFINFIDVGLDALTRFANNRKLEPEMIRDYTHQIVNKLDLLYGSAKSKSTSDSLVDAFQNIVDQCNQYYDFTLIDVQNYETKNKLSTDVLNKSDLVVVCLNQNTSLLDRYFVDNEWQHVIKDKPSIILLGNYDKQSQYTVANISRKYKYKKAIYTIPSCTHYMDAYNMSAVAQFFMRNRNIDRRDGDYFFFEEVRRFAKGLISVLGLNAELSSERGA